MNVNYVLIINIANNHKKVSNHVYKGKPTTAEHSRELNSAKHQPATFHKGKDQQTNKQTNIDRQF